MKARTLTLVIACTVLYACSRAETPPSPPTPPPGPTNSADTTIAATPAPGATPSAAAHVTLSGPASTSTAPGNTGITTGPGGSLQLAAFAGAVQLTGQVTGLTPNAEHGFHVHQTGDCSGAGFTSAGEHFNPSGAMHGAPNSASHHLGDLAALKSDAKGTANASATISGATLNDAGPNDLVGKALIVHARPDDYKTQPSGNSGDRIACGVIESLP